MTRSVYAIGTAARQDIHLNTTPTHFRLDIDPAEDHVTREWYLRLHLPSGTEPRRGTLRVDGLPVDAAPGPAPELNTWVENTARAFIVRRLPTGQSARVVPFAGPGQPGPAQGGSTLDVYLPSSPLSRQVEVSFETDC